MSDAAVRKMTPLNSMYSYYERLLGNSGMNANSCEWIELAGNIDINALRRAVTRVQHKHPVLRARTRWGANWTSTDDVIMSPEIIVERRDELTDNDLPNALMGNVWRRLLPLAVGPALRLHVTYIGARQILQLVTSHVFTDGRSANILVADLLAAYEAEVSGRPFDDAPIDVFDRNLRALYLAALPTKRRRELYFAAAFAILRDALSRCQRIATLHRPRGMTHVIFRSLGSELLTQLREASACSSMSRHPVYVLAAARAITAFNAARGAPTGRPLRFIDNVSVRRFGRVSLENLYELCAIPYMLPVDAEMDDDELMRRAAADIAALHGGKALEEVARQQLLAASASLTPKILGLRIVLSTVVKSNFILSNIGHVPDSIWESSALHVVEYFSFSQLFPPGEFMIFLSTARKELRVTCLYDSANISDDDANGLLTAFERSVAATAKRLASTATHSARGDY